MCVGLGVAVRDSITHLGGPIWVLAWSGGFRSRPKSSYTRFFERSKVIERVEQHAMHAAYESSSIRVIIVNRIVVDIY